MTLTGECVRTIGEGLINNGVYGVAANADIIVVATWNNGMFVFDQASGALLQSFSRGGRAEGELYGSNGIRLTPDGNHVLVAEWENHRLSLFSLSGDFVRCIGVGLLRSPLDVDFSCDGDILVADRYNNRVCVFSPDGLTLLRSFGCKGDAPGKFQCPSTLAVHGSQLFVKDWESTRVQVFT